MFVLYSELYDPILHFLFGCSNVICVPCGQRGFGGATLVLVFGMEKGGEQRGGLH